MAVAAALSIVASLLLLVAAVLLFRAAGRFETRRSVLVRIPHDRIWEIVRDLPDLHSRHGKGRAFGGLVSWEVLRGDGAGAGSLWAAQGDWKGGPYRAEIALVEVEAPRRLVYALRRDSFGTHRALRTHRASLTLEPAGAGVTKIALHLEARLRGVRARLLCLLSRPVLEARLLDLGLRSFKVHLERGRNGAEPPAPGGIPGVGAPRNGSILPPPPSRGKPPETAF
ncbi:MAG: SRPBCC family protein [Candidatus Polarisedimenticolia bacterium]